MSGFEEPEEGMGLGRGVDISRVGFDTRGSLADALCPGFLVPDGDIVCGCKSLDPGGVLG